jgi:rhodanese-related sulfurtransferase
VALRLKNRGITRVHPLEGGVARWMELSYPVDKLVVSSTHPTVTEHP